MSEKSCATPACKRAARPGELMCKRCWRIVPAHVRREVWTTWKAWQADVGNVLRRDRYRDAVQKACDAVMVTLTARLGLRRASNV